MTDAERPHVHRVAPFGHASRLSLPTPVRWLLAGQLLVVALSLQDKEIAQALAAVAGLGARGALAAEVALSLTLLAAWAALTVGWVRWACGRRTDA